MPFCGSGSARTRITTSGSDFRRSRAHRIGQTRVITINKLVAAGTVEERVLAMQNEKRALLANVFEESDAANAALTLADLKALVQP